MPFAERWIIRMKKKVLSMLLPIGLLIELIYIVGNCFIIKFPDFVAYPMLLVSISLILIGIIYNINKKS